MEIPTEFFGNELEEDVADTCESMNHEPVRSTRIFPPFSIRPSKAPWTYSLVISPSCVVTTKSPFDSRIMIEPLPIRP
jgi:hypothetical protein